MIQYRDRFMWKTETRAGGAMHSQYFSVR
uniref:Uncharacterized protein n=1 Tax=Anguilla anguilla TaxID=7936 RepID=A0A0E9R1V4_ANGAN